MKPCFVFLLLYASLFPLFAFAQSDWYKKSETPGASLNATLIAHESISAASKFTYFLKTTGYPTGGKVLFLISNLSATQRTEPGRTVTVGKTWGPLLVDEKGNVLHLDGTPFGVDFRSPSPGESYVVSILSLPEKKQIKTFVKITPVPIESRDGPCYAEAILTAPAGTAYEIRAEGFSANEQVLIAQDSGEKIRESKIKAEKDGSWVLKIQTDGGGKSLGTLTTNITSPSCKLTLSLTWKPHK